MAQLEILVRGEATRRYPPEVARLHASVSFEDGDRDAVYRHAVAAHGPIVAALEGFAESGAVQEWYSDSVRIFARRPYDDKGKPAKPVYSTRIGVRAEFVDFEKLSEFLDDWAGTDGIEIGGIAWDVTDDNRRAYEREVRRDAVDEAVTKGQAYADAVGRGPVEVVRLSDPGVDNGPVYAEAQLMAAPARMRGGGGPSMELRPEDVTVSVEVEAKMIAQ